MEFFPGLLIIFLTALAAFFMGRFSRFPAFWDKGWCSLDLNAQQRPSGGLVDALLLLEQRSGRIMYADDRAAAFYGKSSRELVGMHYKKLLGDDEKELPTIPWEYFRQTHVNTKGEELPVEVTSSKVRFQGRGAILIAIRSVREKSRKEWESEIRKAVLDATYNGVGILSLDREGCPLIDANPALIQALEMPGERVIGAPFFDLLPDQEEYASMRERILQGKGWKGELRVDDGRGERSFFMSIDPVEPSQGMERLLAVVCQDITEKRMAENRLVDAIVQTQQKERKRMANDLHDGVGQTLTAANVYLKTMEKKWEKGKAEKGMEHLPMVSDLVHKGVEEIRNISHDLMPDTLKEYGLIRAIRQMIQELDEASEGIAIRLHTGLDPDQRRNEDIENTLFRVCQELVNNALRHSEASELDLSLRENTQELILEAKDNGKGFDPLRLQQEGGSGIKGLRNRAESLKGTLEMDGAPGEGAFFRIRVPLKKEERIWETSTRSA